MPDPEILIRPGGESRLSNFLLYQAAYTELIMTDRYWPDFGRVHFAAAIAEYQRRRSIAESA
jgi:undecaprenyl diphosphate synthase